MKKIFLSIPVSFRPELRMFFGIQRAIATSKHQIVLYATEGDSLISRARNNHISIFLEKYKDCDYFFSIDCDIEVENNKENDNIFDKLIDHDKDFIGGLYALKRQSEKRCASVRDNGSFDPPEFNSGLVKMKWLSSGCWCIKRSVIEKMASNYPELQYDGEGEMYGKKIYGLYIPFIKEMENKKNKYLSEDWAFIERWINLGGEVYADTSIMLNHIGKYSYNLWK